ncbi:hypothetical protein ACJI92_02290 [Streptococcus pyogenes]|nr:hypothetical protein Javan149_0031 [Streptococcus phage Javan149]HEP4726871.1 hypothetical protein [Streptococcus pyogenes]
MHASYDIAGSNPAVSIVVISKMETVGKDNPSISFTDRHVLIWGLLLG